MHNYISLALATTPSGLGSHCKHMGVPTRLRIGYRLLNNCERTAVTGMGNREEQLKKRNTEFQCAYKNVKPEEKIKCGGGVAQSRRARGAVGGEVPADATGPGARGKGRRLKRYGTI